MTQQNEEETTKPSESKPEIKKSVRAKRTPVIKVKDEPVAIIEPLDETITTEIIEETITIAIESDTSTPVVAEKKDKKKTTKKSSENERQRQEKG